MATPDRAQALQDIADHIKRKWNPKMRRELLQYLHEQAGVRDKADRAGSTAHAQG